MSDTASVVLADAKAWSCGKNANLYGRSVESGAAANDRLHLNRPEALAVRPAVEGAAHPDIGPAAKRRDVRVVEQLDGLPGDGRRRHREENLPLELPSPALCLGLQSTAPGGSYRKRLGSFTTYADGSGDVATSMGGNNH